MKTFVLFMIIAQVSAKLAIAPRIAGGRDAKPGTVPSFVALEIEFESSVKLCGGFLGSPGDRIFTAASCVFE